MACCGGDAYSSIVADADVLDAGADAGVPMTIEDSAAPTPDSPGPCDGLDLKSNQENCGVCGHGCQGGACAMGACQPVTIASGLTNPRNLAIDAKKGDVYWTNEGPCDQYDNNCMGNVLRLAANGKEGEATILAMNQARPTGIALDETSVYGANGGSGNIMRLPIDGTGQAAVFVSNQQDVVDLTVDAEAVYWCVFNGGIRTRGKQPNAQDREIVFIGQQPSGIGVDPATHVLYFSVPSVTNNNNPDVKDGTLRYVHPEGGAPTIIADNQNGLGAPTVLGKTVFWASTGEGTVSFAAPTGGQGTKILATAQSRPKRVAVDETHVYWTTLGSLGDGGDVGDGAIVRVPRAGGVPETVAKEQLRASAIAVDAKSIYWFTLGTRNKPNGTLMKLAK